MDTKESTSNNDMKNDPHVDDVDKHLALSSAPDGKSTQVNKNPPNVEIVDFDLTNVKKETDSQKEDHTMELELKLEIEPDTESTNRLNGQEPFSSKTENVNPLMRHKSLTRALDDTRDVQINPQKVHSDNERPLPPPLMSKPAETSFAPQPPSHSLQPPPLIMNPRLSSDGKNLGHGSSIAGYENNATDEEIMKIKSEIRDDIQSELMNTSGEIGGLGNAVAASFMNPFQSSEKRNVPSNLGDLGSRDNAERANSLSSSMSTTVQPLQTNTTSLLPRSMTNNQMYISKLNSLITTSSYVNLPLCTPNATVSLGPRPTQNVIKDGAPSNLLRIDTSVGSSYTHPGTTKQPQLQNILQAKHVNGTHFALQASNGNPPINEYPVQAIQIVPQQLHNGGNQVKPAVIGQEVRERLVKHLEDKNGELLIQGSVNNIPGNEMPRLVTYNTEGQYSPSPTTPNKGPPGRIH